MLHQVSGVTGDITVGTDVKENKFGQEDIGSIHVFEFNIATFVPIHEQT